MNDAATASEFVYDEVAYPTPLVAAASPERMRAIGLLNGWSAPDPATASVLEIGCGTGEHLIAIAALHPNARCVGFDLSAKAIERGKVIAEKAGTRNVELYHGDILTWPHDAKYDYVFTHGVLTWIPEFVRQPLLELIAATLAPGGVAYIGYDVLPGGGAKQAINQFLLRQTAGIQNPDERAKRAAEIIGMLYREQHEGSRLKATLQQLADELSDYDPHYFFHDWLAEHYRPMTIRGVDEAFAPLGLRFACDGLGMDAFVDEFDPDAQRLVATAASRMEHNETLDLLRGERTFRQDLFVHIETPPPPATDPWPHLTFSFLGDHEEVTENEKTYVRYSRGNVATLNARDPNDAEIMKLLDSVAPNEMTAFQIAERTGLALEVVQRELRRMSSTSLIQPHASAQPFTTTPGDRPRASQLTRGLLEAGLAPASSRMVRFKITNPAILDFIKLCDGTRTREELRTIMNQRYGGNVPREALDNTLVEFGEHMIFEG